MDVDKEARAIICEILDEQRRATEAAVLRMTTEVATAKRLAAEQLARQETLEEQQAEAEARACSLTKALQVFGDG